jgi:hypothetical protein
VFVHAIAQGEIMTQTQLPTEAMIPWTSTAALGAGVAAPSGELLAQAVEPFEVQAGDVRGEEEHIDWVQTEEDLRRLMTAAVSAEFNIGAVSGGATTRLEKSLEVSERSLTILCTATINWREDALVARRPSLTQEAVNVLHDNPAKFRSAYGDYFIAGYTKKASLSVFARLHATDRESLLKVAAEAAAKMRGVAVQGEVEIAGGLEEYARTNNCTITVDVYKDGVRGPAVGVPTEPEACVGLELKDVPSHVTDFFARAVGAKAEAILMHYHRVEPTIPTEIDLDPQVFLEAQALYGRLVFAKVLAKQLPVHYIQPLSDRLDSLDRSALARIPRDLSCDLQTVHLLADQLEDWISEAQQIEDYRKLWRTVVANPAGVTSWEGPAIIEQCPARSLRIPYSKPGWVTGEIVFDDLPGRKVCGYQVIYNRNHAGSWRVSLGGVGKEMIRFAFTSEYDRGINWTVMVWTVPADKVRFEHSDL